MTHVGRPRLLDLYCGAGGAAMGYHLAGYDVVGVDAAPQPHYPFDAIHASPPCQAHSSLRHVNPGREYLDLVADTRGRLATSGVPWVMENVVGAPLDACLILCGSHFGLRVADPTGAVWGLRRHRLFECSQLLWSPGPDACHGLRTIGVYGNGDGGGRNPVRRGWKGTNALRKIVMEIDWMTRAELAQAIPPAYTRWIGTQLLGQ